MFAQCVDSAISGRYTVQAPYKAGAGIGVLVLIKAIYDAPASFLSSAFAHIKVMVGWAGASKDAPVSLITGYANPVQFTTSEIGVSGGGSISPIKEAAIMATIPTLTQPEIAIVDGQAVTLSFFEYLKLLRLAGVPGYISRVAVNPATGLRIPKYPPRLTRHKRVFLSAHVYSMAAQVGASSEAPVLPWVSGNANPAWAATNHGFASVGGSCNKRTQGAVTMTTLPTQSHPEITIINGRVVTTSLAVANYFTKRHERVLDRIRNLECSAEFTEHNFVLSEYTDVSGRKLPCYQITRDGFAFLAMGFTGKRAAQFKEAYINAFNQMEKQLSRPSTLSDAAHNASVLYSHLSVIHKVWLQQLYPMLAKAESPLAISLYDRINDAAVLASLINLSLNPSEVRGRK
ncbi:ash family protein [Escherichia coli]|nr:ash family protein [Escherichia coli]MDD8883010.1 ash family protein [Escherichia coli]